jgi:hypothetical protein
VIRVKVPGGVKLMPHTHPEDRVYTVISGVFYIGIGDRFDDDKLQAYPPGSVIVLPGDTHHFHWAKSGEYVSQVTAIGPLGLEYVDPKDDPSTIYEPTRGVTANDILTGGASPQRDGELSSPMRVNGDEAEVCCPLLCGVVREREGTCPHD